MSECFRFCNQRTRCHYIELDSINSCRFFDKTAYMHITDVQDTLFQRIFLKKQFSKQFVDAVRLTYSANATALLNCSSSSSESCWQTCLSHTECVAITYNYSDSSCFLFVKGKYVALSDESFVSIAFENENIHDRLTQPLNEPLNQITEPQPAV